jgi:endonuclease YncB( thermonuclease family)
MGSPIPLRRRSTGGRPVRSIARSAFDAFIFIAAAALILFGLRIYDRAFVEVPGGAEAIDGDSLRQGDNEIRLYGLDAPEYLQDCRAEQNQPWPCGREAAQFVRDLVRGRTVSCIAVDVDAYGRLVATCQAEGRSLNREVVKQGWAVAYRRHSFAYVTLEAEARRLRRGIWKGTFEEPEKWRERHRNWRRPANHGQD